jgi:hypothetical protein
MKHLETTVQVRDSFLRNASRTFRSAPLRMTLKGYKASGDWDFKTCVYTVALQGKGLERGFPYPVKSQQTTSPLAQIKSCQSPKIYNQ